MLFQPDRSHWDVEAMLNLLQVLGKLSLSLSLHVSRQQHGDSGPRPDVKTSDGSLALVTPIAVIVNGLVGLIVLFAAAAWLRRKAPQPAPG